MSVLIFQHSPIKRIVRVVMRRILLFGHSHVSVELLVCGGVIALTCFVAHGVVSGEESPKLPPAAKRKIDFSRDIRPLFESKCHKCHGSSKQEAGLRLDRRDDALNGGDSGPAFVSGKSAESVLIKYVAGVDPDVVMPPEGDRLSDEQIGLLRGWIDQGLMWPEE